MLENFVKKMLVQLGVTIYIYIFVEEKFNACKRLKGNHEESIRQQTLAVVSLQNIYGPQSPACLPHSL